MNAATHPFHARPYHTVITLSIPLLISLIAEPLTGLVDTIFIARLGEIPLAALGVGTVALSSVFWIFSFLGISTQTSVAQSDGRGELGNAREIISLALAVAVGLSIVLMLIFYPMAPRVAMLLGAEGVVLTTAEHYMRVRLFGAPAVLITLVAFGGLRGRQDMRSPLWIAVGVNVLNIALDGPFIFGLGPIPAMGVAGGALASVISQWLGATAAVVMISRRFGFTRDLNWSKVGELLRVGSDLFIRTGTLLLFIMFMTRIATQAGAATGAAHQAIRQGFLFSALMLDAFAMTAQSLVGYFIGARMITIAKRAVGVCLRLSIGGGVLLAVVMIGGQSLFERLLVPASAIAVFAPAWLVAAGMQPITSFAFVTDGVHWGTGDFRFLRNTMIVTTVISALLLALLDTDGPRALVYIWSVAAFWNAIRGVIGLVRIWPGIGASPFAAGGSLAQEQY